MFDRIHKVQTRGNAQGQLKFQSASKYTPCFLYLYNAIMPKLRVLALFSQNIKIDLSQTFLIRICNIYICPNRVLIYIIDRINVIIIMYIFLRDDIPKHVRRRRTLFWCRRRPCHYTKITFIKSKIQDATFLEPPNRDITNSISKSHFIPSSTFSIIFLCIQRSVSMAKKLDSQLL